MSLEDNSAGNSANKLFEQLEKYPWDEDVEFQGGLDAILGPNPSSQQVQELALRARCFYYERKHNIRIDFDSYKAWREVQNAPAIHYTMGGSVAPVLDIPIAASTSTSAPSSSSEAVTAVGAEPAAPYPTSFAHIVDLITNGKPIPGIKEIPNTVLEGKASESKKAKRLKPWEKDQGDPESIIPVISSGERQGSG